MKRMSINKKLKIVLLAISIMTAVIVSGLIYYVVKFPGVEDKKVSLYAYTSNLKTNFNVSFKPNPLYDKPLAENDVYLTAFVDSIKVSSLYDFQGERPADIKGTYDAVVTLEGFTLDNNDKAKTIWKKNFEAVPKTAFQSQDQKLAIAKDIILNLKDYHDFVLKLIDASKVRTSVKLTLFMNVNLDAKTDKGPIDEKYTSTIEFPVTADYFQIVKTQVNNKPGAVERTEKKTLPINKRRVILCSVILGISLVALLFLVLFTVSVQEDPLQKSVKNIFRKHGSRFVALASEIAVGKPEFENKVRTIEDLVLISDELGKPIMYEYKETLHSVTKFYILDGNNWYVLDLKEAVGKNQTPRAWNTVTRESNSSTF